VTGSAVSVEYVKISFNNWVLHKIVLEEFYLKDKKETQDTAEERANQAIVQLIIDHKYLPGQKLLEKDLAQELNMSRTPIRSALKKLAASGLLDIQSNKGCSVPFLTLEDMERLFSLRAWLESYAAYEAANHITEEQLESLKDLLNKEKNFYSRGDILAYNRINEQIHKSIVAASGDPYLINLSRFLFLRSQLYIFYYDRLCIEKKPKLEWANSPSSHPSITEHEKILRALAEREQDIARILAQRHVLTTMNDLRKAYLDLDGKLFDF